MLKVHKKILIFVLALLVLAASALIINLMAHAEADVSSVSAKLKPVRDTEYGAAGECVIDGNNVYKNYEYGCVTAVLGADNSIMNTRDYGGVNYNKSTKKLEFLKEGNDYKLKESILSRGVEADVKAVWEQLAYKFDSDVQYNPEYALNKIYEKFAKMCDEGYICGIATDSLSVWDSSVIKLDFYDSECEFGFDATRRVHVTTIAYSFLEDEAYAIHGSVFNFYRDAKAGSLSEPITDQFAYQEKGVNGIVQAFALGYIFDPEGDGDLVVRAGTRWNKDTQKFEILELDYDDLTKTDITQEALDDNPYYGGKGFTVDDQLDANGKVVKEGIKTKFYNKYLALIKSGYNPGLPDHEGIYYWDTELLKQAYVGSDGTGNAWGRTNMMLIMNPEDGEVYMVQGEILNLVDKASHGLGNAKLLGYPTSDEKTQVINGLTYTYQNFIRPYYRTEKESTIYTIENTRQLTRHLVGGTFESLIKDGAVEKANNPMYFYVMEPWLIAVICLIPVVLAGAGAALYIFVFKKRKTAKAESTAQETAAEGAEE